MLKVVLIGNLGQDATSKVLNDGTKAINFSVAETRKWTDKSTGEVKEKVTWTNCTKWVDQGKSDKIVEYLKSGTKVYIEGDPIVESFDKKDGTKGVGLKVNINVIELLSGQKSEEIKSDVINPEHAELSTF